MVKQRVEVNQRALVDKVLARYPEDFTVFRELLQNADDARATEIRIEFQTSDYAKHSAGANGKVNGVNGTIPDLLNTKLSKWIVRNNGDYFAIKDWDRLTKIADGNPDEQKIGAFGVGFYSVFSVTDSPWVLSGGKSLSIFFEGDQLFTEDGTCADSPWTSIEMELKEDMRAPVPKPFDLARFLAATMTFMSSVKTTSVFFDDKVFLKIHKFREYSSDDLPIPSDMLRKSEEDTMKIGTVSVVTQGITVEITDWALAAGTKKKSTQHAGVDNLPKNPAKRKGFWSNSKKSQAPNVAPPSRSATIDHPPWSTHTAKYTVYSAQVTTSASHDLLKGLKAMTKKEPPSRFAFEMVYFSKEEHDARAAEEKSDPLGSVFRGPQGLFPELDGDMEYRSRVFIGQSTAQTTGIGGHLSGGFIPTVERGSIDLTNGHIAKWNEELLYVGGFLARLVYEKEIGNIRKSWPKGALTNSTVAASSREKASYAMRCFTFNPSTPDGKVSKILQNAFFNCSNSDCFPIISNYGIQNTKDVRQPNEDFTSFMKIMPILLPTSAGDPPSLIDSLPEHYMVRMYSFRDVVNELEGRILQDDEMVGLLRWWVSVYDIVPNRDNVQGELMEAAKLSIGKLKRQVTLSQISKFIDSSVWIPWLQSDDALPPDTIPFSFTRPLDRKQIPSALSWESMTVVDWLKHLISPQIDSAHDIRKNLTYSNRVLVILGNIWSTLSSDMKSEAQELMEDVPWIATNKGLWRANEAYFQEADVFRDLPVVTGNVYDPQVVTVLTEFGVKKRLDFTKLFEKAGQSDTWSAVEMIRYLNSDEDTLEKLNDIQSHAVFPSDTGKKYCITELYLPHDDIRELGLPILNWLDRIDSEDEQLLTTLGFLRHPPLEKIVEIAGSDDPDIRRAAFKYFSSKFDELYDKDYDPSLCAGNPFIPALKEGEVCVGTHEEVYSDSSWAMMGFQRVHPSVEKKVINRLRMREAPSAEQVIEVFKERPPKSFDIATKWFAFLATKQVLSPGDLQQIANIPIVPVKNPVPEADPDSVRMVPPRECFLGGIQYADDHLYRRLFTFVDFGDTANGFLKACGVKAKPDCSDIINILIKDPLDFLRKTNNNAEGGPEKYLTELRTVAVGYEGLSEEDKGSMRKAPIFVGYHVSGLSNTNQSAILKDEFGLVRACEILIADDMENRQKFGNLVWLAPQDELLEKLYESVGSGYLSNHIQYNVKPSKESNKNNSSRCGETRKKIVENLPIFLHELDKKRLKNPSTHLYWDKESRFLVRGCKDLKVEKRLESSFCKPLERGSENFECQVSAEITEEDSLVTLWLKDEQVAVDMYDVAVALCRLLFKTHKKHDVLSLMTILETDKEVLRRRGYDVDMIKDAHKAAVLEDNRKEKERQEEERRRQAEQRSEGPYYGGVRFRSRFFEFFMRRSKGSKTAGIVKSGEVDQSIDEIFEQLGKGEATKEEQEIRNREHRGASKKLKDVEYCAEQKTTDLELVDGVEAIAGLTRVWKQKTTEEDIPEHDLADFADMVHELSRVLNLGNADNSLFNIFWHPDDPELMGFNRNRLIFLNLAHYTKKHLRAPPGLAYIEWYYIIVHEIAHNKTPFHDEHHELLISAIGTRNLRKLHDVQAVREYFECSE